MSAIIDHVIVLMLENRSFDHLFAYSGIPGLTGVDTSKTNPDHDAGVVPMSDTAPDRPTVNPQHDFDSVDWQIYRAPRTANARTPTLTGFVDQNGPEVMRCVAGSVSDILTQLARSYCVCDNWFSSMPGPTWPNRFFVHAGSSGGLANSPSNVAVAESTLVSALGFSFDRGTLFNALAAAGKSWRVYYGDDFPQVCAIDDMPSVFVANTQQFRPFDEYATDLQHGDVAEYTFIEPRYGILSSYRDGNSQHPLGSLSMGEQLIKEVYDGLVTSDAWRTSMLIITYDEHGGFYDQMVPPAGVPPGDGVQNASKAASPPNPPFAFDRLGLRVPAVVVSPWVAAGSVSHTPYDHSSIIRTVFDVFGLSGQLTERDGRAQSLRPLLGATLQAGPAAAVALSRRPAVSGVSASSPADEGPGLDGYTRIAALVHHALLNYEDGMEPHVLRAAVAARPDVSTLPGLPKAGTAAESRAYIASVAALMAAHRQGLAGAASKAP